MVASEPGQRLHVSGPLENIRARGSAKKEKKPGTVAVGGGGQGMCPEGQGGGSALSRTSEQEREGL